MIRDKNLFGGGSYGYPGGSGGQRGSVNYSSVPIGERDDDDEDVDSGNPFALQKKRMKQQDSNLDALGESVARLGSISLNISNEIKTQNRMLDDLETNVDGASESAESLLQKTKEMMTRQARDNSCVIIAVLTSILIILIVLVVEL
jgi:hypothetical protein